VICNISSPDAFGGQRFALIAILGVILFGLYYAKHVNQWVTTEMLDFTR
jgi:hypothetical protein